MDRSLEAALPAIAGAGARCAETGPVTLDEAYLALVRRWVACPENGSGTDKSWALSRGRSARAIVERTRRID